MHIDPTGNISEGVVVGQTGRFDILDPVFTSVLAATGMLVGGIIGGLIGGVPGVFLGMLVGGSAGVLLSLMVSCWFWGGLSGIDTSEIVSGISEIGSGMEELIRGAGRAIKQWGIDTGATISKRLRGMSTSLNQSMNSIRKGQIGKDLTKAVQTFPDRSILEQSESKLSKPPDQGLTRMSPISEDGIDPLTRFDPMNSSGRKPSTSTDTPSPLIEMPAEPESGEFEDPLEDLNNLGPALPDDQLEKEKEAAGKNRAISGTPNLVGGD